MEDRLIKIEQELGAIRERNKKVEREKAWEVSLFRKVSVAVITFVIAAIALYCIGVTNYLASALIPTIGYILSTQSLPFIKRWWIKKQLI